MAEHDRTHSLTPEFAGKVVAITGAGAGFGEAFAHAFAQAGAAIAILEIDDDNAERVARDLQSAGHKAIAVHCDVADEHQVRKAMARVAKEMGGIDILINNAGLHMLKYSGKFSDLTLDETRRLFEVNITGVISCTLAASEFMAARGGGAIVNIASIAAYLSNSPYGVSKLAVRGLTIAFAQELAAQHIRVNAIAPGLIATPNVVDGLPTEMFDIFRDQYQQIKRRGEMDDIVAMALFLASPAASFVTGETVRVSGGYPLMI